LYKVLISDFISEAGLEILENEVDVHLKTGLNRDDFLDVIGEYDGIIVRSSTQLDKEAIDRANNLKVIGRAGVGYDNIDVEEASKKGIIVFNTPTGNTISAAEHAIAMMLALSRNIPQAHGDLFKGLWNRKKYKGTEVKDKTLGIVGFGRIGNHVSKCAHGLGMNVIIHDPYISTDKAEKLNISLVEFDEILSSSDYISLHVPLTDETEYMLDKDEFAKMKDGVRIINVARGKNIRNESLITALKSGKVAGAAIDVYEKEPIDENNPLLELKDKVVLTCHLGATTAEAMDNVAVSAAEQVLTVLRGGLPESPLNIYSIDSKQLDKAKPYLKLVNKLGNFIAQWKEHERIEDITVEYGGIIAEHNSKPYTTTLLKDILDPVLDYKVNLVNAYLIAKERGIKIKESHITTPESLNNIIKIIVKTNKGTHSIAGTLLPVGYRVVEINNFRIDLNLEGTFLVASYHDKPGIIGKVGTILGDDEVNIASMQVGRDDQIGEAIMIIQTDSKPSKKIMEKIKGELDFLDIAYVKVNGD